MAAQIFTTETGAVRGLAALAWAHPAEFSTALRAAGVPLTADVVPESIRLEKRRIDIQFETADAVVVVEAKVDDFASSAQIGQYQDKLDTDVMFVLLVPDRDAPDVVATKDSQPSLHVVEWGEVLEPLEHVNGVATLLAKDIVAIQAQPSAKGPLRKLMHAALADVPLPDGVLAELAHSASRRPCLTVEAPREYVFGQVEGPRDVDQPPSFKATVGVLLDPEDSVDSGRREAVRKVLETAWTELEQAELAGEIGLSRARQTSQLADLFGVAEPYRARGYKDDYVGVITLPTLDATEALGWAVRAAEAYQRAMMAHWPSLRSQAPSEASVL